MAAKERKERKAGLTLIEVLLAVTILGAGLAVLLTAASRCLAVMRLAKNYQTAQWTLGNGEADHPLKIGDKVEDMEVSPEEYPNGFTYSRTLEEDEDKDGLYMVHIKVAWADRGKQTSEEVVRYLLYDEDKVKNRIEYGGTPPPENPTPESRNPAPQNPAPQNPAPQNPRAGQSGRMRPGPAPQIPGANEPRVGQP